MGAVRTSGAVGVCLRRLHCAQAAPSAYAGDGCSAHERCRRRTSATAAVRIHSAGGGNATRMTYKGTQSPLVLAPGPDC